MKAIKITQETIFPILWELDKRTQCTWNGTGYRPAHNVPYALNPEAKVLAVCDSGILRYYRHIDGDMTEIEAPEFIANAVKQFGKRPR